VNALRTLRFLSFAEGASLLGLLFIGMPLKYVFAAPMAVRVLGSLHGVLFLALVSTALQAVLAGALASAKAVRIVGWSVVPFGFLAISRVWRKDERASYS
jgi:integral membrane protein